MGLLFVSEGHAGFVFRFDDNGTELALELTGEDKSFDSELDIDNPTHILYKGIEAALTVDEHLEGLLNLGTVTIMEELQIVMKRVKEASDENITHKEEKVDNNVIKTTFGKNDENPDS